MQAAVSARSADGRGERASAPSSIDQWFVGRSVRVLRETYHCVAYDKGLGNGCRGLGPHARVCGLGHLATAQRPRPELACRGSGNLRSGQVVAFAIREKRWRGRASIPWDAQRHPYPARSPVRSTWCFECCRSRCSFESVRWGEGPARSLGAHCAAVVFGPTVRQRC